MSTPDGYLTSAFRSRNETAAEMIEAESAGQEYDAQDAQDAIWEWPLSIEKETHVIILLSTGGPHEEIDCTVVEGQITRATFGAYWGGEKVETRLSESDALWTLAERYIESMELS